MKEQNNSKDSGQRLPQRLRKVVVGEKGVEGAPVRASNELQETIPELILQFLALIPLT